MKVNVVRIGNSQGIRIPKTILRQCHLADAVELEVQGNRLVLQSLSRPRAGWEDAFRRMHAHGDDALLDQRSLPAAKWDRTEWQW
jgi:antitoxin MazE